MASKVPRHIRAAWKIKSIREWRIIKRREMAAAVKAVEVLRSGCAYTPARLEIIEATNSLARAAYKMSQQNWGK